MIDKFVKWTIFNFHRIYCDSFNEQMILYSIVLYVEWINGSFGSNADEFIEFAKDCRSVIFLTNHEINFF